jgi:uracil-DNA glycosylase
MRLPAPLDHFPAAWEPLLPAKVRETVLPALAARLHAAQSGGTAILPPQAQWFRALDMMAPEAVRVVILGQDPYPTPGNANGLAFSVTPETDVPRSLKNIYKELESDLCLACPDNGDLSDWAAQGVLLLNTTLTVEANNANSHAAWGWEAVTDALIHGLSEAQQGLVFILWGNNARKKKGLIDAQRHLVIESAHPSPLSARNGFFGSKPFSRANAYLKEHGKEPVAWTRNAAMPASQGKLL